MTAGVGKFVLINQVNLPGLLCVLVLLIIFADTVCAGVEYKDLGKEIEISNSTVGIVISKDPKMGVLGLVDKSSNRSLFPVKRRYWKFYNAKISFNGNAIEAFSNKDAESASYEVKKTKEGVTYSALFSGHRGVDINVGISITLKNDSQIMEWRGEVSVPGNAALGEFRMPIIHLPRRFGTSVQDGQLVLPAHDGLLVNDLDEARKYKGGRRQLSYPGPASIQMLAFYDQLSGVYFAAHDPNGYPKAFGYDIGPNDISLYIDHRFPEVDGVTRKIDYDVAIGVFRSGDNKSITSWWDAADVYKEWAERQEWAKKKLVERQDIPEWLKNGIPFLSYDVPRGKHHDELTVKGQIQVINQITSYLGRNIAIRPTGWEKNGYWISPDYYPAYKDAEFREFLKYIKKDGNRLILYLEGFEWTLESPNQNFNGRKYFKDFCQDCAVEDRNGSVELSRGKKIFARGCRTTDVAKKMSIDNVVKGLSLGADAIQFEVVGGGGRGCYNKKHAHPPGYGRWIFTEFRDLMDKFRSDGKKKNKNFALTIEEPGELYIQHIDGYNGRDYAQVVFPRGYPGTEGVPLFTYIYHEYALGFSGWHRVDSESLIQRRDMAANFVSGKMDGIEISLEKGQAGLDYIDKSAIEFFKEITEAMSTFAREYLIYGTMMHPGVLTSEKVKLQILGYSKNTLRYRKEFGLQTHMVSPQVLHSVWKGLSGAKAYIFANYTERPGEIGVLIEPTEAQKRTYNIYKYTNTGKAMFAEGVSLPKYFSLTIPSGKVMLLEIEE